VPKVSQALCFQKNSTWQFLPTYYYHRYPGLEHPIAKEEFFGPVLIIRVRDINGTIK